ncbi:hypothetical protein GCK72_009181 [Caenorhabditis remanei]|uniref:Glutathione-dependent dehydroascorbate reductase n=1 Tax=Caenorhabditis remanei TaxID=31234 RepID=A0A6A5GZK8_CAERE|nr:hypothetical protein GCK72_009181 [Caenorhabditis remanei]KAF1760928.1 hypothetical protein GCK72_009181 [Caenorhabditis remanei]
MVLTGVTSKAVRKGDPEPPLAPGKFRVYNMRFCPWAEKAMIYVAAKGIDAEVININVTDKPEWYFSKHYQGKAPAIEHNGKIVIESGYIPEYLDDAFPESRILPTDPYEKVQQKLLTERLTAVAHAVPLLFAVMRDRSLKEEKQPKVFEVLKQAEDLLADEFYAGSAPGYPDYLSFPFFEKCWWAASLDGVVDLPTTSFPGEEKYPKLTLWFDRMLNSDAIQSVTQSIEHGAAFMNAYATHQPMDYDLGL